MSCGGFLWANVEGQAWPGSAAEDARAVRNTGSENRKDEAKLKKLCLN